jgi:hypothetical protein
MNGRDRHMGRLRFIAHLETMQPGEIRHLLQMEDETEWEVLDHVAWNHPKVKSVLNEFKSLKGN